MDASTTIMLIIPNLGSGGAQKVFRDQLAFFRTTRMKVIAVVFNWDGAFAEDKQSDIISLDVPAGSGMIDKMRCFNARIKKLRHLKREHHVTHAISHLEGADYVNLFSKHDEKIICWIHGSKKFDANITESLGVLRKKILIPFVYRRADRVVTVSRGIMDELHDTFNVPLEKMQVIFNGFDLAEITRKSLIPLDADYETFAQKHFVLLTHCRLSLQKNVEGLLTLFSRLPREGTKLVIIGDGELRDTLLRQSRALNLNTYDVWSGAAWSENFDVYFMGFESNPYPWLKASSLYVMTSNWEGFPLSLCEAMACGMLTMSTDCFTGPREILAPALDTKEQVASPHFSDYGVLMPMLHDDKAFGQWVETIQKIGNAPEAFTNIAQNATTRIADFDALDIQQQWLKLIT